jgi:hypothetical protein
MIASLSRTQEVTVQTLHRRSIPANVAFFRARTGVFAPCPQHFGETMIRHRSHSGAVREISIGSTNSTNTVLVLCTSSVALQQTVISGPCPLDFGTYSAQWVSGPTVMCFPASPLRNRGAEGDDNVVEFRSLPPRIESLSALHGRVRFSTISPSLERESRIHSPRIESAFEELPE